MPTDLVDSPTVIKPVFDESDEGYVRCKLVNPEPHVDGIPMVAA